MGSSESKLVKISQCKKSHVEAQMDFFDVKCSFVCTGWEMKRYLIGHCFLLFFFYNLVFISVVFIIQYLFLKHTH